MKSVLCIYTPTGPVAYPSNSKQFSLSFITIYSTVYLPIWLLFAICSSNPTSLLTGPNKWVLSLAEKIIYWIFIFIHSTNICQVSNFSQLLATTWSQQFIKLYLRNQKEMYSLMAKLSHLYGLPLWSCFSAFLGGFCPPWQVTAFSNSTWDLSFDWLHPWSPFSFFGSLSLSEFVDICGHFQPAETTQTFSLPNLKWIFHSKFKRKEKTNNHE